MIPLADIPAPVLKIVVGFWRRRWIVLALAWALAVPGWYIVSQLPDTYTSNTKVHIDTDSVLDQVLKGIGTRPPFQDRVDLLRLRLLSRPNIEQVATEIGLDLEARTPLEFDRMKRALGDSVQVKAIRDNYFEIRYTSSDPVRAQQVVNGFLNIFIESDLSTTVSGMDRARSFLDQKIAEFDEDINRQQREIAEFRRQYATELNAPTRVAQNMDRALERLKGIAVERQALERQQSELEEQLRTTPYSAAANDPELERLRELLLDYKTQYTDEYPAVVNLVERIKELEDRLRREGAVNPDYSRIQSSLEYVNERVAELDAEESALREDIAGFEDALNLAPAALADLEDIKRGLGNLESRRRALEDRRLSLDISAGAGESGERIEYDIVEKPIVPLEPNGPPRLIYTVIVLISAMGAGGAAALALILIDRSYSQADDLEDAFGIPVIGTVSIVAAGVATAQRFRQLGLFAAGAAGLVLAAVFVAYVMTSRPTPTVSAESVDAGRAYASVR